MGSEPILFLRRWLKDPLMIGAIAPSSRELAAAMARLVPVDSQDPVIELGGGTGVITQALLDAGIAPARLFVVERDGALHDLLVKRFPEVRILLGSAADLTDLLRPLGVAKACAVVSGLPLLAMRDSLRDRIVEESFALLGPSAPFIQFTYGLASPIPRRKLGIQGEVKSRVLNNLPPASVWLYHRPAATAA
ncbi:MAG TPA: methyltransferase [Candidatus Angelobacter sp.]|nr:methyltransferase [Candidatus Angelobacter sp.]